MSRHRQVQRMGFTLIEILSAMAVLMILVLLLGRLFRDSTNAWQLGTRRSRANMEARAVLSFIAQDVSQAVADDVLALCLESEYTEVFGVPGVDAWDNDALWFVSLSNDPDGAPRAARETWYYVDQMEPRSGPPMRGRYRLVRATRTDNVACYNPTNSLFWTSTAAWNYTVLADNVASFEVYLYGWNPTPTGFSYRLLPDYNTPADPAYVEPWPYDADRAAYEYHKVPAFGDFLLTMLDEADAVKASEMFKANNTNVQDFVNRAAKRHEIRVGFMNQSGYGPNR